MRTSSIRRAPTHHGCACRSLQAEGELCMQPRKAGPDGGRAQPTNRSGRTARPYRPDVGIAMALTLTACATGACARCFEQRGLQRQRGCKADGCRRGRQEPAPALLSGHSRTCSRRHLAGLGGKAAHTGARRPPVAGSGRQIIIVRSMEADRRQAGWLVSSLLPRGTRGCHATVCTQSSWPISRASRVAPYSCRSVRNSGLGA